MVRRVAVGVALLAVACLVSAGDRDVAEFLFKKAEKALRARDYEAAVAGFQRARQEYSPLPEAAFGLGQALEKLEREAEAIAAYRACIEEVKAEASPPFKWKGLARRAGTAIARLRRRFADLDRINQAFVERCLKFSRRHRKDSPRWSRTALETVLRLDPSHVQARRMLEAIPAAKPPAKEGRPAPKDGGRKWGRSLIRGDDLAGWDPGIRAPWTCADGIVAADVPGRQGQINWLDDETFEGRYEVRVKIRVVRHGGAGRTFGLLVGNGSDYWHCFFFQDDNDFVLVRFAEGGNQHLKDAIPRNFNAHKWHVLRLEIDRGAVTVHLDDRPLLEYMADERDAFDGKLALFAQNGRIEFKELEVRP